MKLSNELKEIGEVELAEAIAEAAEEAKKNQSGVHFKEIENISPSEIETLNKKK